MTNEVEIEGARITVELARLARSPLNVRKTASTKIDELAAQIKAQGLMYPLYVVPTEADAETFEVIEGDRRLQALQLLARDGDLPEYFPVECVLVDRRRALEVSIAGNSHEPMHPADQFEAFKALIDSGKGIEEVAATFGVTTLTVRRRLKLAAASPRLLALYRNGKMSLDQLMALSITDDHATQEAAWDNTPEVYRNPERLRDLVTEQHIDAATDPVARFVGVKAYERAGGAVLRDLFQQGEGGFLTDLGLLERLAQEKLEREAQAVQTEGWAWVEVRSRITYAELAEYGRARTTTRALSAEEQTRLDELSAKHAALAEQFEAVQDDDDEGETAHRLDEELAQLETTLQNFEESLLSCHPDDQAVAGVLVTTDATGQLALHRGLVKPQDRARIAREAKCSALASGDGARTRVPGHSERLQRSLTTHYSAALGATLAQRPEVALVAVVHCLVSTVFDLREASVVRLTMTLPTWEGAAPQIEESRAGEVLGEGRAAWQARLDARGGHSLFDWLLQWTQTDLLALLAYCTACSVDTIQSREPITPAAINLARAVQLDMADWWTPTTTSYLAAVPKARVLGAVTEACGEIEAAPLAKFKKDALIAAAEKKLQAKRWLPELLRAA